MKVLVIGSGGREHALVWKIAQSPLVKKIYCAPGNPGIGELAENVSIEASNINELLSFAKEKNIDLTIVGPEDPLVDGIVDKFEKAGLKIFGPSKMAARLEGSKAFSKDLMNKYNIPTAEYETFNNKEEAFFYLNQYENFPIVLKASGLAAGKGVLICQNKDEAIAGLNLIMGEKAFGSAGNKIVIEEFLEGEEISIFALCDGNSYKLLSPSQDHKRVFDNDQGKNTGGMGAYAPAPLATTDFIADVEKKIIKPTISAMIKEGSPYKGLLYVGLIITSDGMKVLEYNCRFGDPETEVVLPLLNSDLVPLMLATIEGTIQEQSIDFKTGYAIDVVVASGGYPDSYEKGKIISGLDSADDNTIIFHAGTKTSEGKIVTSGGRVLNIVTVGDKFKQTQEQVYKNVKKISFDKMHYRKDIGNRALAHLA